ncbi:MAG: DUF4249 domain-containing protein [Bacteroidia bacterium]
MKKIISSLLIFCGILASCTKVVNIDLNSTNPNIVVNAEITDQPGTYTVNLTQTVNFSDNNNFPPVTGADVVISDNAGNTETLTETGNGNYVASHLHGTVGWAYHISITSNNKNYTATSIMPAPVALDSVIADTASRRIGGGGFGGGNSTTVRGVSVHAVFTDPAGIANYYRLIEYINHVPNYSNITIISDQGQDGSVIARSISRRDTSIHAGDTITVALESIDANVYEYYRTLRITTRSQTGIQTATPGNPTTNLSNNALGVFSAYAVRTKYTIAP